MRLLSLYSLWFVLSLLILIPSISVAQIEVTSVADSGPGSLREAIETTAIDGDIITFNLVGPSPHTITLTSGEINIDNSITINGPGSDSLIVSGNDSSRIFRIDDSSVNVLDVFIRDITLTDGNVTLPTPVVGAMGGAAILTLENLTLEDCVLSSNTTQNTAGGGALYNLGGILNITSCEIFQNEVIHDSPEVPPAIISFDVHGGGIYSTQGALTLTLSNISENTVRNVTSSFDIEIGLIGGGIYNEDGPLTIEQSCIFNNTVFTDVNTFPTSEYTGNGGGVAHFRAPLLINNSTFSGNTADSENSFGGGLYAQGVVTMPPSFPTGTIVNSTFSTNTSTDSSIAFGGGIAAVGFNMDISNTTIALNLAIARVPIATPSGGAGIYAASSLEVDNGFASPIITLRNTLVVGNRITLPAGPVLPPDLNSLDETDTVLSERGLPPPPENCDAAFDAMFPVIYSFEGNNISDINSPFDECTPAFDSQFDFTTMLGPLQDNGGACETHALINVANNNAIDGVPDGECTDQAMPPNTLIEDERMFFRPVNFTGTPVALCDIGAFELQAVASITITKSTSPSGGTGFEFASTGFPAGCDLEDSFTLDDFESISCVLPLATYTVTETPPSDYTLDSISCIGGTMTSTNMNTATINLMNFENVVCTFFNVELFNLDVMIQGVGEGEVTSENPGIECSNTGATDCDEGYGLDTVVTLSAEAQDGSVFTGWSGDAACTVDPTNPVINLTMNMDISCIATFLPAVELSVEIFGPGQGGVMTGTPDEIDCSNTGAEDCEEIYPLDANVTLNAIPEPGSVFTSWSGDAACTTDPTNPVLNLTMNTDISCQAAFAPAVTLMISVEGNSEGGVLSTNPGIDCNSSGIMDCDEDYAIGSDVVLTATPVLGSTFTGWSGDAACTGDPTNPILNLTMNVDISCTATFSLIPVMLDVTIQGSGEGGVVSTSPGIDCNSSGAMECDETYLFGDVVILIATALPGSSFTGWSGDDACTGDPLDPILNLIMDTDISCLATFDLIPTTLDITIEGNGEGGVLSTNPGIDCNATGTMDCVEIYNFGTMVTLTATPLPGSSFTGWSGDTVCITDPLNPILNLTMDMDISCIATFVLDPATLDVVIEGNGSCTVTSVPDVIHCPGDCAETFDPPGVTVDLTATPEISSLFAGWSGDCSGQEVETSITVNEDSTCIATCVLSNFILNPIYPALDDNVNFLSAENATPNGRVAFTWANRTGSLRIGGNVCNGLELGLNRPKLMQIVRANQFGVATYTFFIPFFSDFEFQVQLQAVDIATCRTSNIVPQVIRKDES